MGITDFDKFVFDSERKAGDFTSTAIKTTSDSTTYYMVVLFEGEGEELWYLDVENTIGSEKAEAKVKELESKYAISVKDKLLKYVNVDA